MSLPQARGQEGRGRPPAQPAAALVRLWRWWRTPWYKRPGRLRQIEEDMYYEQADRDGVEYPPQYRGR
jgi:hypothetical protein